MFRYLNYRRILLALIDGVFVNAAILAAFALVGQGEISDDAWVLYYRTAPWVTSMMLLACLGWGLYHRIWEFARADAALGIFLATTTGIGASYLVMTADPAVSYTADVLVIIWLLTMFMIAASRFGWREVRRRWARAAALKVPRRRLLIYGADRSAGELASRIDDDHSSPYEVIGFIAGPGNGHWRLGMRAAGHPVLGSWQQTENVVEKHDIQDIVIADSDIDRDRIKALLQAGQRLHVNILSPPPLLEVVGKTPAGSSMRTIRYDDIIERKERVRDLNLQVDYVSGKRVLVTGAGGSIGSEICRQLCRYRPAEIILFGRGENRIHEINLELRDRFPDVKFSLAICNFANEDATADVFNTYRPEIVFHAGAHKHVYLMEQNPIEAVRNNVLGTRTLADIAEATGVAKFVFISTDKAVEPTTVMGATKRFCEEMLLARNNGKQNGKRHKTQFIVVRFGNVVGSAGSVLLIFEKQLQAGKPLTVTHPEVDRFFMTIREAAFLVLQAGALSKGGDLYVLDMGEPRKILDIAKELIELHGKDPDAPGMIEFTGLTPGEKLHEGLTNPGEVICGTTCPLVNRVCLRPNMASEEEIDTRLRRLQQAIAERDSDVIRHILDVKNCPVLQPIDVPLRVKSH